MKRFNVAAAGAGAVVVVVVVVCALLHLFVFDVSDMLSLFFSVLPFASPSDQLFQGAAGTEWRCGIPL